MQGVIKGLYDLNIELKDVKYIMASHIHLDHSGGSWRLLQLCPNAVLHVHPKGVEHVVDPSRLVEAARRLFGNRVEEYGEVRGISRDRVLSSEDHEELNLGGVQLKTMWTPGHASHHQSYFVPGDGVVLLGDAGGTYDREQDVLIPTSPPPFNPELAVNSIEKLMGVEPTIACYGHFGFTDNAMRVLRIHKDQIVRWTEILGQGLRNGIATSDLYERLRYEDPMLKDLPKFTQNETDLAERTPLTNIRGFVEYFKWLSDKDN